MMMVVTLMAVALHADSDDKGGRGFCQIVFCRAGLPDGSERAENGAMRRVVIIVLAAVIGVQGMAVGQSGSSEPYSERYGSGAKKMPAAELVDINRASSEELMKLPGMTKVWADRVVKFRPYKRKTELLEHGVLPDRVYDKVKDYVVAHREDK
jgi:DNA uptake protein ComE-like DNA-binding protein